jgi:putative endonuclease
MYYVYVLRSKKDGKFYVGYTADLRKRMEHHSKGIVESTRNRRPLELIYYEACVKQQDALHREEYLKTAYGKRYIKNRLKEYLHALD